MIAYYQIHLKNVYFNILLFSRKQLSLKQKRKCRCH